MGEEIRRVLRTKQAKLWGEKTRSNAKRSKRAMRLCFWGKRSGDIAQRQIDRIKLNFKSNRGVAQMVARLVRDQEAVGSNPATPTINKTRRSSAGFIAYWVWFESAASCKSRTDVRDQATEPSAACGRWSEAEEEKNKEQCEALPASRATMFFSVSRGFKSRHFDQKMIIRTLSSK